MSQHHGPHARPLWHEAYDAQMALWRWYRTERSKEWLRGMYHAAAAGMPEATKDMIANLLDGEMGRLIDCDPIYVSEEMTAVVDVARESFQPEPLLESDLPTPRGFLYFARPIIAADRHDQQMHIQAVSWARQYRTTTADKSAALSLAEKMISGEFLDETEKRKLGLPSRFLQGEFQRMIEEGLIEAYGIGITLYCERSSYLDEARRRAALRGRQRYEHEHAEYLRQTEGVPVVPMHVTPWWFNMSFDGNAVDALGEATAAEGWWRLVQTTLRLMLQKKKTLGYGRPQRATRREGLRLGFPAETEVVIVRLRREEHPRHDDHEPSGRSLTYRHLRTGHWRNQWYPSEQIHRQIYIDPTVVGDESLPLIVRPRRVFQWTR